MLNKLSASIAESVAEKVDDLKIEVINWVKANLPTINGETAVPNIDSSVQSATITFESCDVRHSFFLIDMLSYL